MESEKLTKLERTVATVVNTEENIPSSEAVASTSTGEMAVNYSRHLHHQAKKCWSVIVTSRLCLLIDYFSSQASLFDDLFHMNGTFRQKWPVLYLTIAANFSTFFVAFYKFQHTQFINEVAMEEVFIKTQSRWRSSTVRSTKMESGRFS